ncbi:phosphomannomutase/phosphoglucomutase, partial [Candidatus Woesearchaeota archaeon]|nr:phosphomannomutase/phosphoglucomutase [Candidatus Woesearchaeota archaeon]
FIKINFEPDGNFPNHEPNQLKEENYKQLIESVKKNKADIGIIFDGDADRAGFIDEKGNIIALDLVTALIADYILKEHPKQKIVYEVRSSWAVREWVEKNGGTSLLNKAGHSFIKQRMRDEEAVFGGEKSGHYFFKENFYADDAMIAATYVLNILSSSEKTFSELIKPLQIYYQSGEINSEIENKDEVIQKIEERYKDGKVMHVDGITVEFDDWWFNLRKSNTEPVIRLNLETKTKQLMEDKTAELLKIIRA